MTLVSQRSMSNDIVMSLLDKRKSSYGALIWADNNRKYNVRSPILVSPRGRGIF
jgi:hypothetical protein